MARRPPTGSIDTERLMKRVEDTIDNAFKPVLDQMAALKMDVLKGNMNQEFMSRRLSEVEMQILETRQTLQISEDHGLIAAKAVTATAVDAAKALAAEAPKSVWKTKLGLITAGSAAFVAIVAFFKNLPAFVRGASEVAVALYQFIVRHHP